MMTNHYCYDLFIVLKLFYHSLFIFHHFFLYNVCTFILAIFLPVQVELCYLWCMGPIQNRHMPVMVELDLYVCSLAGGTDVDVPTEEPKCLVCLCCNTVYMAIPFKIQRTDIQI
jgi:hypothetical protein